MIYNNRINYISILTRLFNLDVINLIKNISDDNIPYKHSDLIHISNINKEQLELFFKTWKDISKTRKLDLLEFKQYIQSD